METMYPRSMKLQIPVVDAGPGFDVIDLERVLGAKRFQELMGKVEAVFCCNHATYPQGHEAEGAEVHCVYARDLETFLEAK